jgi:hypothetical protein
MPRYNYRLQFRLRSLVVLVFVASIGMTILRLQQRWAKYSEISQGHGKMKAAALFEASGLESGRSRTFEQTGLGTCGNISANIKRLNEEAAMHSRQELEFKSRW